MKIGDFFKSATSAQPVNPKPITITVIARGTMLPGGGINHAGKAGTRARVKAAFAFIGDGVQSARLDARAALRERFKDPKTGAIPPIEDRDVEVELVYQQFFRVVHEWDENERKIGDRQFPNVESVRELVEWDECNRVMGEYYKYMTDEHPEEGVDPATFREAQG